MCYSSTRDIPVIYKTSLNQTASFQVGKKTGVLAEREVKLMALTPLVRSNSTELLSVGSALVAHSYWYATINRRFNTIGDRVHFLVNLCICFLLVINGVARRVKQ